MKTKTLDVKLRHDEYGEFIPYCTFEAHKGIALRPGICEERKCHHYHHLYVKFYRNPVYKEIKKLKEQLDC